MGDRRRDGWKGALPHYAFQCPAHGIVEGYPHGYEQRLESPRCIEEKTAPDIRAKLSRF